MAGAIDNSSLLTVPPSCLLSPSPGECLNLPLTGAGIVASADILRNDRLKAPSIGVLVRECEAAIVGQESSPLGVMDKGEVAPAYVADLDLEVVHQPAQPPAFFRTRSGELARVPFRPSSHCRPGAKQHTDVLIVIRASRCAVKGGGT